MGFSKASLRIAVLILGTICLYGCGRDARSHFITEIEAMIRPANEGRHGDLETALSKGLVEKIRAEGWEPKAALIVMARKDREQGAAYRLMDVPRFGAAEYAEAEILRTAADGERRFLVPFLWEDGRWRAGAAYRDGRAWETGDF